MTTHDPITSSETLSIRLASTLKSDLGRLARVTKRTRSFLAAEAVEAYVARELQIIESIERGLADMRAGRVVSHEQVAADMRQAIEEAVSRSPEKA